MTAIGERPATGGHIRTLEHVTRPDGSVWRAQTPWPPRVYRENTPDGPVVLVLRTHNREKARRLAEVRWQAFYPGVPLPEGELEWRRHEGQAWVRGGRDSGRGFQVAQSTGTETRSYPVVCFRPPPVASS